MTLSSIHLYIHVLLFSTIILFGLGGGGIGKNYLLKTEYLEYRGSSAIIKSVTNFNGVTGKSFKLTAFLERVTNFGYL